MVRGEWALPDADLVTNDHAAYSTNTWRLQRRNPPQYRLYSLEIAAETTATKSGHSGVQDIEKLR